MYTGVMRALMGSKFVGKVDVGGFVMGYASKRIDPGGAGRCI